MFGYLLVNKPELKFREYDEYHACYCGICRQLREQFGVAGQVSVSYDATFLVLLLTALYEPYCLTSKKRCFAHPIDKNTSFSNEYTIYGSKMNLYLSYYNSIDDWNDEKNIVKHAYAKAIRKDIKSIERMYPEKCKAIQYHLRKLESVEQLGSNIIDEASGCFGNIMREIFDVKRDEWNENLKKIGFYIGKFIYLMDAYEDIEKDIKKNNYNVFISLYQELANEPKMFSDHVRDILTMMMTEAASEFEKLPIVSYVDILRNILYSGVWVKFQIITNNRMGINKRKNNDG